jgi:hypothetical protein
MSNLLVREAALRLSDLPLSCIGSFITTWIEAGTVTVQAVRHVRTALLLQGRELQ